jgi:hypothetical protein
MCQRWAEFDEDDQCVLELDFAAVVLRALLGGRDGEYRVTMPDSEERAGIRTAAVGASLSFTERRSTIAGTLTMDLAPTLFTCTLAHVDVWCDGAQVLEVTSYLEYTDVWATRDEAARVVSALGELRGRWQAAGFG